MNEWVWSNGGMILTEEIQKTPERAILFIIKPSQIIIFP